MRTALNSDFTVLMQAKHTTQLTHGWTIGSYLTNLVNLKATDLERQYSARIPKTQYCVMFPEFIPKVKSLHVHVVLVPLHELSAWHVLFCEPPKVYPCVTFKGRYILVHWTGCLCGNFPLSGGGSTAQVTAVNTMQEGRANIVIHFDHQFQIQEGNVFSYSFQSRLFFSRLLFLLWSVISNTNSPFLHGVEHSSSFLMFILIDLWFDFQFRSV